MNSATKLALATSLLLSAASSYSQNAPIITTQPANESIIVGGTATFIAVVSGSGPLAFQWQFDGTNLPNGLISTVAGTGTNGFAGDGGAAANAELSNPYAVAVDTRGNLFIADFANQCVRRVGTDGIITTVAGNGSGGFGGDGGAATNASLDHPSGVAVDGFGNLFIADAGNQRIRMVGTNGIITTVAGNGTAGLSGDGGVATSAKLNGPSGVAVDGNGNVFIADSFNSLIREVGTNGIITTLAGGGIGGNGGAATNAALYDPFSVAVDGAGNVYFAERSGERVRMVGTDGILRAIAGTGLAGDLGDGGLATNATLDFPSGVAVDVFGEVFITDADNNRVRRVGLDGIITTVAGNGARSYSGDGGAPTAAGLYGPYGVAVGGLGRLYVADTLNQRVRKILLQGPGLEIVNASAFSAGNYDLVVTSPYGSVTSSIVSLSVVSPPVVARQPQNESVAVGSSAAFGVTVLGTPPFGYQWYFGNAALGGETNSALVVADAAFSDAGGYQVVVTNVYGSVTSSPAVLTVGVPPVVTTQPASEVILGGTNTILTVSASGVGPFSYQWRLNGTNLPSGIITTVAGDGKFGYTGDGGLAVNASLINPSAIVVDAVGNLYIADSVDNYIRKVATNGVITTVAGGGTNGPGGIGGLAIDSTGNLYFSDTFTQTIRKIDTNGVSTIIGGRLSGLFHMGYGGDGGPATNAVFNNPLALAVDSSGNVFIVDSGNYMVRKVATNGIITAVAGLLGDIEFVDGVAAIDSGLFYPSSVAADGFGNLFISDSQHDRVRKVDTNGIITTVAGVGTNIVFYSGDGGPATNATLYLPNGVAVDGQGNLIIADQYNCRVRKVGADGTITTIAGIGPADPTSSAYSGDGVPATNAAIAFPSGVALDGFGNVFIADTANNRVREIISTGGPTLPLNNVGAANAGNYEVVVTGQFGSVTSSVASLALVLSPQPANLLVAAGNNATFSVSTAGSEAFTYQWYFGADPLVNQTNAVLTLADTGLGNAGSYYTVFTGASGSLTSSPAILSVGYPPKIESQPANQIVTSGSGVTLQAGVSGTGPFTYQWQLNGTNLPNIITTVAGNGTSGFTGDGGAAVNAELAGPTGLALDSAGNLLIADTGNNRVRELGADGVIEEVAGGGTAGLGNNGPATNASLGAVYGLAVDGGGNFYIVEEGGRVRKVDANGIITTIAGGGRGGYAGDGGATTNAGLEYPQGVAVDGTGNVFIANTGDSIIRRVDTNGNITTVAGIFYYADPPLFVTGPPYPIHPPLRVPQGVAVDNSGNLFVADTGKNRICKLVANGILITVAGSGVNGYTGDGGLAINAGLSSPTSVAVDGAGNFFIADERNHRIRRVDTNGIITTVAGSGANGYSGDGGAATNADLNSPYSVAVDRSGNVFISDSATNRIREVLAQGPSLSLANMTAANAGIYNLVVTSPYGSVTSSSATVSVLSALHAAINHGNSLSLQFTGGTPGQTFVLETATSLQTPVNWQPVYSAPADGNGNWTYTDSNLLANSALFYRVTAR